MSNAERNRKVLVVEDDPTMAVALEEGLRFEGFEVKLATDGETGLRMATEQEYDLLLLDVMLPKLSGMDVCRRIRRDGSRLPIIMLTAQGQEADKVQGLKLGADDYVTKPFSFVELMARVEAVLRRARGFAEGVDSYEFGDISLDFRNGEARRGEQKLDLSPRELKLLGFMIEHRGEILPRERLLDAVWGYDHVPFTRTVDMHIAKLRKKIEPDSSNPQYIVTVHRVGYKFNG